MPYLKAAVSKEFGQVLKDFPPKKNKAAPRLVNRRYDMHPSAKSRISKSLKFRSPHGWHKVDIVTQETPWCRDCSWYGHDTGASDCPKASRPQGRSYSEVEGGGSSTSAAGGLPPEGGRPRGAAAGGPSAPAGGGLPPVGGPPPGGPQPLGNNPGGSSASAAGVPPPVGGRPPGAAGGPPAPAGGGLPPMGGPPPGGSSPGGPLPGGHQPVGNNPALQEHGSSVSVAGGLPPVGGPPPGGETTGGMNPRQQSGGNLSHEPAPLPSPAATLSPTIGEGLPPPVSPLPTASSVPLGMPLPAVRDGHLLPTSPHPTTTEGGIQLQLRQQAQGMTVPRVGPGRLTEQQQLGGDDGYKEAPPPTKEITGEEVLILQQRDPYQSQRKKVTTGGLRQQQPGPYDRPSQDRRTLADASQARSVSWADMTDTATQPEGLQPTDLRSAAPLSQQPTTLQEELHLQHRQQLQPTEIRQPLRSQVYPGSITEAIAAGKPWVVVPLVFTAVDGLMQLLTTVSAVAALTIPHFELHEDPSPQVVLREVVGSRGGVAILFSRNFPFSVTDYDMDFAGKWVWVRFTTVLSDIIHPSQTRFIPGRQILHNVMMAEEIVELVLSGEDQYAIVLLDLEKAYDRVGWEFLQATLTAFGFGPRFKAGNISTQKKIPIARAGKEPLMQTRDEPEGSGWALRPDEEDIWEKVVPPRGIEKVLPEPGLDRYMEVDKEGGDGSGKGEGGRGNGDEDLGEDGEDQMDEDILRGREKRKRKEEEESQGDSEAEDTRKGGKTDEADREDEKENESEEEEKCQIQKWEDSFSLSDESDGEEEGEEEEEGAKIGLTALAGIPPPCMITLLLVRKPQPRESLATDLCSPPAHKRLSGS
ncbi:hypothetical protein CBR_g26320 [Chara braunii]|uniref:Uncharacterized protein n=1 Tax=Chara braunii TaxID=69332 RepID=A0A388L7K2_CHABU|nr:hypothetical protein CBR_g26320 [Chara braunii]|eukprot:GBG78290.1 hypothetical protein CBR_g26320 [Chara braunii]